MSLTKFALLFDEFRNFKGERVITEGHGRYLKTDFKFPGGKSLNCNLASGVRDSFVNYLESCYKDAAKWKSDIDDYVKAH